LLSDANVPVRIRAQQRAKYSSLQLTANCIAAKSCLRHYFKLIWGSPTTNSNRMASRLTAAASFPSVVFQLLQYSTQHPRFLAHRAAVMTNTDLTYGPFSLRSGDFAVQFCFCCKFSFHEKRRSSQLWQWRDFPGPITILCYAQQPMKLLQFV